MDSPGFDASQMVVVVRSDSNVTALSVSYITLNYKTAGFASYGGRVEEPILPGNTYRSVEGSLSYLENFIYGINGFAMGASSGVSLEATIDKNFVVNVLPGQISSNFIFSYILFGVTPVLTCTNCNTKLPDQYGNCLSSCNPGEAQRVFNDGSQGCAVCSPKVNTVVSPDGKGCICRAGTVAVGNQCRVVEPINSNVLIGPGGNAGSSSITTRNNNGGALVLTTTTTTTTQSTQNNVQSGSSSNSASVSSSNQYAGYNTLRPIFGNTTIQDIIHRSISRSF